MKNISCYLFLVLAVFCFIVHPVLAEDSYFNSLGKQYGGDKLPYGLNPKVSLHFENSHSGILNTNSFNKFVKHIKDNPSQFLSDSLAKLKDDQKNITQVNPNDVVISTSEFQEYLSSVLPEEYSTDITSVFNTIDIAKIQSTVASVENMLARLNFNDDIKNAIEVLITKAVLGGYVGFSLSDAVKSKKDTRKLIKFTINYIVNDMVDKYSIQKNTMQLIDKNIIEITQSNSPYIYGVAIGLVTNNLFDITPKALMAGLGSTGVSAAGGAITGGVLGLILSGIETIIGGLAGLTIGGAAGGIIPGGIVGVINFILTIIASVFGLVGGGIIGGIGSVISLGGGAIGGAGLLGIIPAILGAVGGGGLLGLVGGIIGLIGGGLLSLLAAPITGIIGAVIPFFLAAIIPALLGLGLGILFWPLGLIIGPILGFVGGYILDIILISIPILIILIIPALIFLSPIILSIIGFVINLILFFTILLIPLALILEIIWIILLIISSIWLIIGVLLIAPPITLVGGIFSLLLIFGSPIILGLLFIVVFPLIVSLICGLLGGLIFGIIPAVLLGIIGLILPVLAGAPIGAIIAGLLGLGIGAVSGGGILGLLGAIPGLIVGSGVGLLGAGVSLVGGAVVGGGMGAVAGGGIGLVNTGIVGLGGAAVGGIGVGAVSTIISGLVSLPISTILNAVIGTIMLGGGVFALFSTSVIAIVSTIGLIISSAVGLTISEQVKPGDSVVIDVKYTADVLFVLIGSLIAGIMGAVTASNVSKVTSKDYVPDSKVTEVQNVLSKAGEQLKNEMVKGNFDKIFDGTRKVIYEMSNDESVNSENALPIFIDKLSANIGKYSPEFVKTMNTIKSFNLNTDSGKGKAIEYFSKVIAKKIDDIFKSVNVEYQQ